MLFCAEKFLAMGEIFQKPSDGKRSSFSVAQGKDDISMEGGNGFSCRHLIGNPLQNQTRQKADPKTAFRNGENGVIIPSSKTDIGRKTFSAEKSVISAFCPSPESETALCRGHQERCAPPALRGVRREG